MFRKDDFGSILSEVDVTSACGDSGYSPVIISNANYELSKDSMGNPTFGFINDQFQLNGQLFDSKALRSSIRKLHKAGAKVYVSFGGPNSFFSKNIKEEEDADHFVYKLAKRVDFYHLDGIDFVQGSQDSAYLMAHIIKKLNGLRPKLKIMYTIPANGTKFSPWMDVVEDIKCKVDFVQILAFDYDSSSYSAQDDFARLEALGVQYSQMVYGVMPGQSNYGGVYTTLCGAFDIGKFVALQKMAGATIHSINRDTNHRTVLVDPIYQTGEADGAYAGKIRKAICKFNEDPVDLSYVDEDCGATGEQITIELKEEAVMYAYSYENFHSSKAH
jgi:hypothetical protein